MSTAANVKARYASLPDDELLELARKPGDLTPEARRALAAELKSRGLSYEGLESPPPAKAEGAAPPKPPAVETKVVIGPLSVPVAASTADDVSPIRVEVVNIRMGFWAMVFFMVKWTIATIPALIILILIVAAVVAALGGVLGGVVSQLF